MFTPVYCVRLSFSESFQNPSQDVTVVDILLAPYVDCYVGEPGSYNHKNRQRISMTKSGNECQRWDAQSPHVPKECFEKRQSDFWPHFILEYNSKCWKRLFRQMRTIIIVLTTTATRAVLGATQLTQIQDGNTVMYCTCAKMIF